MNIGELAKKSGLPTSCIRFYESKGLLCAVSRQINGYRKYPPEALLTLNIITNAQQAGFSLEEIKKFLPTDFSNWNHDELVYLIKKKIADIELLEQKLRQNKDFLQSVMATIDNKPDEISCTENAKAFLSHIAQS